MAIPTKLLSLGMLGAMALSARSQSTYSVNPVGYINLTIYPGDNLIANPLDTSPDNTLDTLFPAPALLPGATFSEWNSANQLLPLSVFNGTTWSIDYTLEPNGLGGVLDSPGNTTVTLIGSVPNVNLTVPIGSPGFYTFVPPVRGPGTYLLSMAAPLLPGTFEEVVGSDPIAGDSVETLDATTQTYTTTTFNGTSWNNGTPSFSFVDEAAYFTLVPEPSTFLLIGLAAGSWLVFRRRHVRTAKKPLT